MFISVNDNYYYECLFCDDANFFIKFFKGRFLKVGYTLPRKLKLTNKFALTLYINEDKTALFGGLCINKATNRALHCVNHKTADLVG